MLLALVVTGSVATAPVAVVLHHSRTETAASCPDEAWLKGNVAGRLGSMPFVDHAPTTITTRFDCTSDACTAELSVEREGQPARHRTLTSAPNQCRELAESLSLALALVVDPQLALRAAKEAASPPPPPPVLPAPSVEPSVATDFMAVLGGHGSLGVSPYPTFGGFGGVGLAHGWFSLMFEGRVDASQSVQLPGGAVSSTLLLGSLLPCGHAKGLGVCLAVSAGALQVSGDLPLGSKDSTALVLVGGRLEYELPVSSWLAVRAHLGVGGVVTRVTVEAKGGPVWVTSQVAGDAGLALQLRR